MQYRPKNPLRVVRIRPQIVPFGVMALVVLTVGLVTLLADKATAVTWKAVAANGDWTDAANWDGGVPTSNDDAHFGPSNFTAIDLDGNVNVFSLNFSGSTCAAYTFEGGNSGMMNLHGDLTIGGGVTTSQTFSNSPPVSLLIAGGSAHAITNNGTGLLNLDSGIMSGIAGAVVTFGGSGNTNVANLQVQNVASQLSIVKEGSGTLTLNGDSSGFSGAITVNEGTLKLGHNGALGSTAAATTVKTGGTLDLNGCATAEPIILDGGTLRSSNSASTVSGTLTLNANSNLEAAGVHLVIEGKITGSGGFTSSGTSTVRLHNTGNDYTGPTVLGSNYTDLKADEVIPNASAVTLNKSLNMYGHTETIRSLAGFGTLYNTSSTAKLIIGANDGGADFTGHLNSNNEKPINIVKVGAGTQIFSGVNNYLGTTTVEGGTLKLGSVSALGSTAAADNTIVKTGGTLDLNGYATAEPITLNGGTLTNSRANVVYAAALTLDSASVIDAPTSVDLTINSAITGAGGLTKTGLGTVVLGAANGYLGNTTVQQGTLKLAAGGSIGVTPLIDVQAGASFDVVDLSGGFQLASGQTLMGTGGVLGNLALLDGSLHAPGSSPGIQTVTGDYNLLAGATLQIELDGIAAGSEYDQVNVGGTVTLGGDLELLLGFAPAISDTFTIIHADEAVIGTFADLAEGAEISALFGGRDYDFVITYRGNDVVLGAVPEPSALAMLAMGIALMLVAARRRR